MYLAMLLVLVAWGLWLGQAAALLLGPVFFVAYLNRRQIEPEERALAAAFGDEYQRYRRTVRRWL
jgi:protein-S-isoprenylcysteine O-methyltransferase Ste14